MSRIAIIVISAAALFSISCGPTRSTPQGSLSAPIGTEQQATTGTVEGISDTHGNVYLSISADQYQALGLVTGAQIRIVVGQHTLTLPVVENYGDVPSGDAMAVLHREGLTLAIRDGNFSTAHAVTKGMPFTLRVQPASR